MGGGRRPGTLIDFRSGGDGGAYERQGGLIRRPLEPGLTARKRTLRPRIGDGLLDRHDHAGHRAGRSWCRTAIQRCRSRSRSMVGGGPLVLPLWSRRGLRDPIRPGAGSAAHWHPLLMVEFRIDRPASPKLLGVHPTDDRSLGLFFSRTLFLPASADGGPARERSDHGK